MKDKIHISLCSGVGGASLGVYLATGQLPDVLCEFNEYNRRVLARRFPSATLHRDLRDCDLSPYKGRVSILEAGTPCQPYSRMGRKMGANDERDLTDETIDRIAECMPDYFLFENVRDFGLKRYADVRGALCSSLAELGYSVAHGTFKAIDSGAPHERARFFLLARRRDAPRLSLARLDKLAPYSDEPWYTPTKNMWRCASRSRIERRLSYIQAEVYYRNGIDPNDGPLRGPNPDDCEAAMGWPSRWSVDDDADVDLATWRKTALDGETWRNFGGIRLDTRTKGQIWQQSEAVGNGAVPHAVATAIRNLYGRLVNDDLPLFRYANQTRQEIRR